MDTGSDTVAGTERQTPSFFELSDQRRLLRIYSFLRRLHDGKGMGWQHSMEMMFIHSFLRVFSFPSFKAGGIYERQTEDPTMDPRLERWRIAAAAGAAYAYWYYLCAHHARFADSSNDAPSLGCPQFNAPSHFPPQRLSTRRGVLSLCLGGGRPFPSRPHTRSTPPWTRVMSFARRPQAINQSLLESIFSLAQYY